MFRNRLEIRYFLNWFVRIMSDSGLFLFFFIKSEVKTYYKKIGFGSGLKLKAPKNPKNLN